MNSIRSPKISVIVANYNCEAYLNDALQSALNQTIDDLEIIFVDDCSTDRSVELANKIAESDPRLTVVALSENGGPSRARNEALKHANGEWVAILDSDDILHPTRLQRLLEHAQVSDSDIVADDLLVFYSEEDSAPHSFLGESCATPFVINTVDYIESNHLSGQKRNSYGFLKPMIRKRLLDDHSIGYDESLDNSEDYELVLQLLLKGAQYSVFPFLGYFYRKRNTSISHRLGRQSLVSLLTADEILKSQIQPSQSKVIQALRVRRKSIQNAIDLFDLVTVIKSKNIQKLIIQIIHKPFSPLLLQSIFKDKWQRRVRSKKNTEGEHLEKPSIIILCGEPAGDSAQNSCAGVFSLMQKHTHSQNSFQVIDVLFEHKSIGEQYSKAIKGEELELAAMSSSNTVVIANDPLAAKTLNMAFTAKERLTIKTAQDESRVSYNTQPRSLRSLQKFFS